MSCAYAAVPGFPCTVTASSAEPIDGSGRTSPRLQLSGRGHCLKLPTAFPGIRSADHVAVEALSAVRDPADLLHWNFHHDYTYAHPGCVEVDTLFDGTCSRR